MKKTKISRRSLVLMLIGLSEEGASSDSIAGITRLQKFLFLLEKEFGLTPTDEGFEFKAYKAGPYSAKLYDDLELLENLDFLESEIEGDASEAEAAEVDLLDFDELMSARDDDSARTADTYEERKFTLSEKGHKRVKEMIREDAYEPLIEGIRKIKSKYGHHSLNDLLYYVYNKYPEMATESEIRDQVLRRRRRRT